MGTELIERPEPAGGDNSNASNNDIARIVSSQEALERNVPRLLYVVIVGVPFAIDFLRNGGPTFSGVFTAVISFFLAKLAVWVVRSTILYPLHRSRYQRAEKILRSRLTRDFNLSFGPFAWTLYAPGAIAATRGGDLVAMTAATGFEPLIIPADSILDTKVEKRSELVTSTRHSGRSIIGGGSGSLGVGYMSGGASQSVTRALNEFFLEVRYQLQKNGPVSTLVIPGGDNHRVVEELSAAIRRLEAQAA